MGRRDGRSLDIGQVLNRIIDSQRHDEGYKRAHERTSKVVDGLHGLTSHTHTQRERFQQILTFFLKSKIHDFSIKLKR